MTDIDLLTEKAKIEREIQEWQQKLGQIDQLRNNLIIELAKKQGMLELLVRLNGNLEVGLSLIDAGKGTDRGPIKQENININREG